MFRIAICDDDLEYIEYLEELIKNLKIIDANDITFYRYTSGEELVSNLYMEIPFDLLILDMQLKQYDGDETAGLFRKHYPDTLLVFCSGVKLPTVKSFEVNAYRYLLKKYDNYQMTKEIETIIKEMQRRASIPAIKAIYRNDVIEIPLDSILYVSIRKHGCNIHIKKEELNQNSTVLSNKKIDEVFKTVEKYDFVYAHNSYFINLKYVKNIVKHDVTLVDGTTLSIARSKEKSFKDQFIDYVGRKY